MLIQIFIGSVLIILSVIIQVLFIEFAVLIIKKVFQRPESNYLGLSKFVLALSGIMFWLLISLSFIIWMWAFLLISLGIFSELEESLYFALVAFTTLGFSDLALPQNWRLLTGFIAADGFVLFGLNTAVLLETMIRLRSDE